MFKLTILLLTSILSAFSQASADQNSPLVGDWGVATNEKGLVRIPLSNP